MTVGRFEDAEAFRASLEQRIRNAAEETGTPHDRIRKDVAFHRLVARFVAAGDDRWAIKGGVALLWRVGAEARATRDVDANWRGTIEDLNVFLDKVLDREAADWFEFEVSAPRPLQGETEGGLRFGVTVRLDGRQFAAFRLDVNLTTDARLDRASTHPSGVARVRGPGRSGRSDDLGRSAARRETARRHPHLRKWRLLPSTTACYSLRPAGFTTQ